MIRIKKGGQQRLVTEHKLAYWLRLGFEIVEPPKDEKQALKDELDALGVEYDKRLGVDKLTELLEGAK